MIKEIIEAAEELCLAYESKKPESEIKWLQGKFNRLRDALDYKHLCDRCKVKIKHSGYCEICLNNS